MNSLTIAGNIARDGELRVTSKGDQVLSFSVADNQGKDKQAIFWQASLFGKRAESLRNWLKKGQAVTIAGTVTQRQYKDKEGQEKTATEVRVIEIALQGKPPVQETPKQQASNGFADIGDDSIPF